jgi:sec-independent protein translocase protein TatB
MNFLGVGPFELLLILVIATIVLGPERMAQAGRTLGRLYAQYRRRWQRDVDELTRELRRELAMLQQELEEIRQTAEGEVKTVQAELESVMDTQIDLDAAAPVSGTQPDADANAREAGSYPEPAATIEPLAGAQASTAPEAEGEEVEE